jgi:hypothetical protein
LFFQTANIAGAAQDGSLLFLLLLFTHWLKLNPSRPRALRLMMPRSPCLRIS